MLEEFKKYSFLLQELVKKGIKLKYRRSYLGIAWSMLEPLLYMIVLTIVFGELLGRGSKDFPVYVLAGRLLYSFYSSTTKTCLKSIQAHSGMIRKVYVPKYMYPLSSVLTNFIIFALSLPVLVVVSLVLGIYPTWRILLALIPLVILFLFAYGTGMILATVGVFFRDMEYIWSVALTLLSYTSAIFYYPDKVMSGRWGWIIEYNPLFCIIDNFRSIIYSTPINWSYTLYAVIWAVATCVIGMVVFHKQQDKFILYV